jgi:hypothetical protein
LLGNTDRFTFDMSRPQPQVSFLLVVLAILAIAGGLAVVIITSLQLWEFGPAAWLQALVTTPTPVATDAAPTATSPSPTRLAVAVTASVTAQANSQVPTATLTPTDTPAAPEITPTAVLSADVTALAVVVVQGVGSARVRNQHGGDTLVAAVPSGTQVQVLGGRVQFNNVVWLQVRLPGGQVGWIADFLLRITQTFS